MRCLLISFSILIVLSCSKQDKGETNAFNDAANRYIFENIDSALVIVEKGLDKDPRNTKLLLLLNVVKSRQKEIYLENQKAIQLAETEKQKAISASKKAVVLRQNAEKTKSIQQVNPNPIPNDQSTPPLRMLSISASYDDSVSLEHEYLIDDELLTEYAKKLKEMADQYVHNNQFVEAYYIMQEGLQKDPTVKAYQEYIQKLGEVAEIEMNNKK